MEHRKFTDAFREKVVKEYLADGHLHELSQRYELNKSQIMRWTHKYQQFGCFPDNRGRAATGRPRKIDISHMSQEEYVGYLEMENAILKQLCSPGSNRPK